MRETATKLLILLVLDAQLLNYTLDALLKTMRHEWLTKKEQLMRVKFRDFNPPRMPKGLFDGSKRGIRRVCESKVKRDLPLRDIIQKIDFSQKCSSK